MATTTRKYCALIPIFCHIIFLLMISHPPSTLSQDPSSSSPTIAQCTSSLLPLIPCAPFVQGTSKSPVQACCGNLRQLYGQEPHCLCLMLNDTTMSSFPINRTLALQLPGLCDLQVDISTCPGEQLQVPVPVPATSPVSPISFRAKNSSTVAASSPAILVAPRSSMMGFQFGSSQGSSLKANNVVAVAAIMAILLLTLFLN
ncbi:hypothetical protein PIB30_035909 [Stylosanthes scabra]|uniref:Bifunctional inhibitor/plant lipid transfer protein/seed storage helical domain-containing protein n=1 Tax=Stylosanthes scabra TaxID=79078 RepID=A0ABU6WF99_9FABA|nr:hypothetical protein [Stylosanthes scabra]